LLRDPLQVADEALVLQRRGARSVIFADAGFNRPLDHAKEVLNALIAAGVRLRLSAIFEPGEVDREFASLFRRAGGFGMLLFCGSLSDEVLAASRKPFQVSDVVRSADLLRRSGIHGFLSLTFGGPGETPATVEETFRVASEIRPLRTLVGHGYRIEPETELHSIAVEEGTIGPDDDCFKATFYHSPETPPDMLTARLKSYRAEHRWDNLRSMPSLLGLMWDKLRP
jgi:radical SAM superfamily enzyme YgiQ (UPF0313 family)